MYSFIACSKPSIIVYTSCAYYLYLYIDNTRALSIILMQRAAACAGNSACQYTAGCMLCLCGAFCCMWFYANQPRVGRRPH